MTKDQRKILLALLGLIAAVIAAIGGGWAVHLALSYQNNSITAMDGGFELGIFSPQRTQRAQRAQRAQRMDLFPLSVLSVSSVVQMRRPRGWR